MNTNISGNQSVVTVYRDDYKKSNAWRDPPQIVEKNHLSNTPKDPINIPDQSERFHTCVGETFLLCVKSYRNRFTDIS